MARCSRVWGMTLSSAATTSSARSIPPTPASMFLMKRSWPGTSTMLTSRAAGEGKPREPQVDGHLPFLLLGQAVGVYVGEGLYESRFAVVYVARGADDVHDAPLRVLQ